MKKKVCALLLFGALVLSLLAGCSNGAGGNTPSNEPQTNPTQDANAPSNTDPNPGSSPYELNASGTVKLTASGMCTYSFEEEQDEEWADGVTDVYVREMPDDPAAMPVSDSDSVDMLKYTVSTTKIILDSDLFPVDPSTDKEYEVTML